MTDHDMGRFHKKRYKELLRGPVNGQSIAVTKELIPDSLSLIFFSFIGRVETKDLMTTPNKKKKRIRE
jgi:hypothetical protein